MSTVLHMVMTEQGKSDADVAKLAGLDASEVNRIRCGVVQNPGARYIFGIAKALGIDAAKLFGTNHVPQEGSVSEPSGEKEQNGAHAPNISESPLKNQPPTSEDVR